jgi:uncharacterized membrane protein
MRFKDDIALTDDGDHVWKRASDLKAMPRYWQEIKAVEVLRVEDSETIARFQFGMGECDARVVESVQTMVIYYTKGPFTGTQRISVHGNRLEVDWNVAFHGIHRLFSRGPGHRLVTDTNQALARLVGSDDLVR